jgi:hypothetical protein
MFVYLAHHLVPTAIILAIARPAHQISISLLLILVAFRPAQQVIFKKAFTVLLALQV